MIKFTVNQKVKVVKTDPMSGNKVCPPLNLGEEHSIKEIILDKEGNQHIDVGLFSEFNYITSFETKEELDRGDKIHWCHPSRFELVA